MSPTPPASPQTAEMSSYLPGSDVPDDFQQMWQMAQVLAKADAYVPTSLREKPANLLALMVRARALNIPMAVAWDMLYTVDENVAQRAKLVRALARRAGHRISYEADDYHAEAFLQLAGESAPTKVTFTIQEAERLGLLDAASSTADAWLRQPKAMLIARVTNRAITWYCPEVMLGLGSSETEAPRAAEIDPNLVTAAAGENRAKVSEILKKVQKLNEEEDGKTRLLGLQELYKKTRDDEMLDVEAYGMDGSSVRRVLTEKMWDADALATRQAKDKQDAVSRHPAKKAAAKKTAKKAAAKKTAQDGEAPADGAPGVPRQRQSSEDENSSSRTRPAGRAGGQPGGRAGGSPSKELSCGCTADEVIENGKHGPSCGDQSG